MLGWSAVMNGSLLRIWATSHVFAACRLEPAKLAFPCNRTAINFLTIREISSRFVDVSHRLFWLSAISEIDCFPSSRKSNDYLRTVVLSIFAITFGRVAVVRFLALATITNDFVFLLWYAVLWTLYTSVCCTVFIVLTNRNTVKHDDGVVFISTSACALNNESFFTWVVVLQTFCWFDVNQQHVLYIRGDGRDLRENLKGILELSVRERYCHTWCKKQYCLNRIDESGVLNRSAA